MNAMQKNIESIFHGFEGTLTFNKKIHQHMIHICSPIEQIGISFFYYIKIYNDGKRLYLTNRVDLLDYIFEKNLVLKQHNLLTKEIKKLLETDTQYFLWTGAPQNEMHGVFYQLNIGNTITFYNKMDDFVELYGFGSEKENTQIINLYINNLDVLRKFVFYFKENLSDVINNENDEILVEGEPLQNNNKIISPYYKTNDKIANLLKSIPVRFYYLRDGTRLSKREAQCLLLLSRGKTIKEISKELDLSPRTVESYIETVKIKLRICSKSELINVFLSNLNSIERVI